MEKPDYGRWTVEPRTDPLTGAPIATAYIKIDRLDFITGRVNSPALQLMCFRGAPVVRIAFNVKVGSNRSAELTYRFDDRPGRTPAAAVPFQHKVRICSGRTNRVPDSIPLPDIKRVFPARARAAHLRFCRKFLARSRSSRLGISTPRQIERRRNRGRCVLCRAIPAERGRHETP